jgi:hypothetical protein
VSNQNNIIQRGRLAVSSDMLYSESAGGTTISSSLPYVADLDQFKVSIQYEGNEWRLRMNKGVVEYMDNFFDDTMLQPGQSFVAGKVITEFNIYPTGSKTTGTGGDESQAVEQNGHIVLDPETNYKVFVYSITPESTTFGGTDTNNPQLVVCKEGDDPNYIFYNWTAGGGGLICPYLQQTINNYDVALAAGGSQIIAAEQNTLLQVYKQVDCARHNIAHIIWDAAKGWQVRQLQYGPFILQSTPIPGPSINYQIIDGIDPGAPWTWDPSTFPEYAATQAAITGYDKNLTTTGKFGLTDTAPTGTRYLKPT